MRPSKLSRLAAASILLLVFSALSALPAAPAPVQAQPASPSTVAELPGPPIQFEDAADYVKLNFTMFTVEFYKGSAGSNKIYDRGGAVVVYDDRVTLEYWSGSTWKQRGTPTGVAWTKVSDYHYEVTRFYDDYVGTTCNVTYTVKSDSPLKISVRVKSGQTDTYRVYWAPSGIVHESNVKQGNRLTFGDEDVDYGWIGFDWSDVYQSLGDITATSVESVAQGKKANIYFNIGTVAAGETVVIDPSTVGTSTTDQATTAAFQRKTFYANGRYWVFYSDGAKMMFRTSTDGSSWTAATQVRSACDSGQDFSVWVDGMKIHYAYAEGYTDSHIIYYRKGTLNSDGTITWSAAEQTAENGGPYSRGRPKVAVDSDGYPWIIFEKGTASGNTVAVTKSSTKDGTWTTDSGFPHSLRSAAAYTSFRGALVPLTNGKMYATYTKNGNKIKGQLWNGSAWGTEETATSSTIYKGWAMSMTSSGDDVYLAFLSTSYNVIYVNRTSGSWGSEATIKSSATSSSYPSISADGGDVYVFWAGSPSADHIYYRKHSGGSWGSEVDWIDESTDGLTRNDALSAYETSYGGKIGLTYLTGSASPYNVRFAYLSLNTAPTNDACDSTPAFDVDVYGWVNVTVTDADGGWDKLSTVDVQVTTASSETFTLRWTESTDAFTEQSDPDGIATLDASGSVRVNIDTDTDKYSFRFKVNAAPAKGACNVEVTTTDDSSASDQDTYTSEFTINFYISISVDDASHGWTGLSPGAGDVQLNSGGGSDGDIDLTVTSNAAFTLQAKGSGALDGPGSETIPLGNVKVHTSTLGSAVSLTTTYADIGGLTGQTRGVGLAKSFKLWITVPSPCQDGSYTYTLWVQGVESP